MSDDLKPCPFCGYDKIQVLREITYTHACIGVGCLKCLRRPFTAIREDAAAKNRKQGTVTCPRCGGELGYSISSYNGHIHGQCNTTRECLSWMM